MFATYFRNKTHKDEDRNLRKKRKFVVWAHVALKTQNRNYYTILLNKETKHNTELKNTMLIGQNI